MGVFFNKNMKRLPDDRVRIIDTVGKRNTGTTIRFLPEAEYFDTERVSYWLKHLLRAKAVLSPGLRVAFNIEGKKKMCYVDIRRGLESIFLTH